MAETFLPDALAVASGGIVGLVLGLIGGGGSILAVPLLVYVVGVSSPHVAIGTAATAVAMNAAFGLGSHARQATVKWPCAIVFAAAGIGGAALGAELGKRLDGQMLLALYGVIMVAIGVANLRKPSSEADPHVRLTEATARHLLPRLVSIGFGVGMLAGFFGIGGGFLIVPGLMLATGMPMANAVGTSLVAVTAFGLTTSASYAASGFVDWRLASLLVAGGVAGTLVGVRLYRVLASSKDLLKRAFASCVVTVGIAIIARSVIA
ncbi:MAG: sulfite exporter TauE/SafE family protein [Hyphomicrobium sp.]